MTTLNPTNVPPKELPVDRPSGVVGALPVPVKPSRGMPEISSLVFASTHHPILTGTLACVFAVGFGIVASLMVPAQYLASSYVKVTQRESFLLNNRQSRADEIAFLRAQEANVVQSRTLERALEDPELRDALLPITSDDKVDWLKGQIKADIPMGSEMLTITASNPSSKVALNISKAVTNAYVDVMTEQLRSGRSKRIQELELATLEADIQLKLRWQRLQDKAERFGSGNPQSLPMTEQMKLQEYRENAQRLRTIQLQRSQLEIQLADMQAKESTSAKFSDQQLQELVSQAPEITSRTEHLRQVDAKIRDLQRLSSDPKLSRLVNLRSEREQLAAELDQWTKTIEKRVRSKWTRNDAQPARDSSGLEKQIALLVEEENYLQQTLTSLETVIERAGGTSGVELEILRHEISREKDLADSLWKTLQELRIEEQAEPRISLIEIPDVVDKLSRSKQLKAISISMIAGLLLAVFCVGYGEWSSCKIRYSEEVTHYANLQVFGAIGSRTTVASSWWRRSSRAHGRLAASGASEAASLILMNQRSDGSFPNVFVTSAEAAEPRGLVADELAQALCHNGLRVLLVNCDPSDRTLGNVWKGANRLHNHDNSWNSEIWMSTHSDAHYMSMIASERTLPWIANQELAPMIEKAKALYDCLIVQGPAILTTAESLLVASKIEFSLLVFGMGKSRWNLLAAARSRLGQCGTYVMGAVHHDGKQTGPWKQQAMGVSRDPKVAVDRSLPMSEETMLGQQVNALQEELKSHQNHLQLRAPTKPRATRQPRASVDHRKRE
jgi:Mrp family chromosome partitioning ATPase/capsular polysaccharide biosynthesis protein